MTNWYKEGVQDGGFVALSGLCGFLAFGLSEAVLAGLGMFVGLALGRVYEHVVAEEGSSP